jgi:hypothetical protein
MIVVAVNDTTNTACTRNIVWLILSWNPVLEKNLRSLKIANASRKPEHSYPDSVMK